MPTPGRWFGPVSVAVGVVVLLTGLAAEAKRHRHSSRTALNAAACEPAGCPFGGDDTGCLPTSEALHQCHKRVAKAVAKLTRRVIDCHTKQADAAYATFRGDQESFDEEACEHNARQSFDESIMELATSGGCRPETSDAVGKLRDLLLADKTAAGSLDAINGSIYCDSTSGALIDPQGDDAGAIPRSKSRLRCSDHVAKELGKLAKRVIVCHVEAGDHFQDGEAFDEEACESDALARFAEERDEVLHEEHCPGCLNATSQNTLADAIIRELDDTNELIYPCPATTTTTINGTTTTTGTGTTSTTSAGTTTTSMACHTTTTTTTHASTTTTTTSVPGSTTTTTHAATTTTTTTTPGSTTTTTTAASTTTTTHAPTTTTTTTTAASTTTTTHAATTTTTTTMPPPTPHTLKLTTTVGSGNCGASRNDAAGAGTILKNLSCGGLDIGGGNNLTPVGEGPTPSGATNLYAVGSCAGTVCPISQNSTAPAANSTAPDCSATGCSFGTPLPIVNGSTSTCVVNKFHANASGTIDTGSGAMSLGVDLDSHIFLTGDIRDSGGNFQVCPICQGGTCTTGPNHGLACTSTNPDGLTRDCPPGAGADEGTCTDGTKGGKFCHVSTQTTDCPGGSGVCQGPFDFGSPGLHVNLSPFQTGTSSKSDANGLFCPGQIAKHRGCFNNPGNSADTNVCRFISETGSAAAGGLVTGGAAKPVKIGSVFCIPATGNPLIDDLAAGLPGPGATALQYNATVLP
jgi:hypothetical protein